MAVSMIPNIWHSSCYCVRHSWLTKFGVISCAWTSSYTAVVTAVHMMGIVSDYTSSHPVCLPRCYQSCFFVRHVSAPGMHIVFVQTVPCDQEAVPRTSTLVFVSATRFGVFRARVRVCLSLEMHGVSPLKTRDPARVSRAVYILITGIVRSLAPEMTGITNFSITGVFCPAFLPFSDRGILTTFSVHTRYPTKHGRERIQGRV